MSSLIRRGQLHLQALQWTLRSATRALRGKEISVSHTTLRSYLWLLAAGMASLSGCVHVAPVAPTEQIVSFASAGQAAMAGSPVRLNALLLRPAGRGPFPAIILLHGCDGLRGANGDENKHYYSWARHLQAEGFAALLVDSYGSRGLPWLCPLSEGDRPIKTDRERVRDAYGALLYLQERDDVLPGRVGALGWSNGGQAALWTIAAQNQARPPLPKGDFRAALVLYPGGCRQAQQVNWITSIPLLMLIGELDDFTGVKPCVDLATGAKLAGAPVEVSLYPGAHHAFDAPDSPVRVAKDVVFPDGRSPTVGTHNEARAESLKRVPIYFRSWLSP